MQVAVTKRLLFGAIILCVLVVGGILLERWIKHDPEVLSQEITQSPNGQLRVSIQRKIYGDGLFVVIPCIEIWVEQGRKESVMVLSVDDTDGVIIQANWLSNEILQIKHSGVIDPHPISSIGDLKIIYTRV